tara:strand:- start:180 stop:962 length:783 start_codon:yes stop_codon:yes gene_type:complete
MLKILKYSFIDLARSRWTYVYLLFYLTLGFVLLFLNNDLGKGIITIMNIIIILVPLISTIFGVMYYYNSAEFTELLLAMPINRPLIFIGQYLGVAISLSISLVLGLGIPFLIYGLSKSEAIWDFSLLLLIGSALSFIFTGLAFNLAMRNDNKIKGFSYAILLWLFLAVIYDGIFLMLLIVMEDYPLDVFALIATAVNPIDLSRILVLLKLDISALMGYTGAVFKSFAGTLPGMLVASGMLFLWTAIPILGIFRKSRRKDF